MRQIAKSNKFLTSDKAQAGSIVNIIVVVVVLMLAALVLAPLQSQAEGRIEDLNNTQATDTFEDISDASWGSLSTASIIPYVIVFVVILALISGLGRRND